MKEKEATNDGQGQGIEVMEKEVLEMEETPLLYTQAPGHYLRNPLSKRLNHTSVVK